MVEVGSENWHSAAYADGCRKEEAGAELQKKKEFVIHFEMGEGCSSFQLML